MVLIHHEISEFTSEISWWFLKLKKEFLANGSNRVRPAIKPLRISG